MCVTVHLSALLLVVGGVHVSAWANEAAGEAASEAVTEAAGEPTSDTPSTRIDGVSAVDTDHDPLEDSPTSDAIESTEQLEAEHPQEVIETGAYDAHESELHALEKALAADADDTDDDTESDDAFDATNTPQRTGIQRAAHAINNALNPEISLTLNVAASYFSSAPMQVGHHDPQRNGFTFQELELAFSANVDPYFKFKGYLSATEHGVELEEAYAQTTSLPARLQLRAGKFLNRFGRINSRHPHTWNFLDMPLVMGRFLGEEGLVGTGIEASWLAPTPWYLELVMSAVHGSDARSFRGEDSSIDSMRDFVYLGAIKNHFSFGPSWSLAWGVSGAFGRNNATWDEDIFAFPIDALPQHGLTQIYGTDLYLRFRPVDAAGYRAFSLQFEFMHRRRDVGGMLLSNSGLYTQAIWNISQRWEVGARYEWMDGASLDDLDPEWTGDRHRLSVQGTFYPSHFSRIRLQTNYDHPTWSKQPIVAVMLGLELSIGAHGAHRF